MDTALVSEAQKENRLTAEKLPAFCDALEVLYIPANRSARLRFMEGWAPAAQYIFGEELSRFDREGTSDKERCVQLEKEAEERRAALLELAETVEKKSAEKGVLQVEYVRNLITQLGRETSLYMYSPWLVDRYAPAPAVPVSQAQEHKPEAISQDPAAYEMAEAALPSELTNVPIAPVVIETFQDEKQEKVVPLDPMDVIKPISVEAAPPVKSEEKKASAPRKMLKIFGIKDSSGGGSGDAGS